MSTATAKYQYTIRRKVFTLFGAKFHVYNENDELIGFSKQKAFKLKEDIRVFTDKAATAPLISIKARSIIDFSASYDVVDKKVGQSLGALRRKGMASFVRDAWEVLDANDRPIAKIEEDSMFLSLLRRFLVGSLVPQKFVLRNSEGTVFAKFSSNFNPFVQKLKVDVYENCPLQPMLVLAAGILLVAVEGRQ